jgi:hypothetical protein
VPIKPAAQILFDRVMATWIYPELQRRVEEGLVSYPALLTQALILCKNRKTEKVFLNDEVRGNVVEVIVDFVEPVGSGQPVLFSNIAGLKAIRMSDHLRSYSYVFFIQGKDNRYYLTSRNMSSISREFSRLNAALSKQGVAVGPEEYEQHVYFDFTANLWHSSASLGSKRKAKKELTKATLQFMNSKVRGCVERKLRLPVVFIHPEDEFLLLLMEVRETYVDGHFFSSIAAAATTADIRKGVGRGQA